MKHVQVTAYCDGAQHDNDEGYTPATIERTLSIDGSKPVLLDLCDGCDKPVADLQALMKRGSTVDAGKVRRQQVRSSSPEPCPEPGCGHTAKNRNALGTHTRTRHGKGLKAYMEPS